MHQQSLKANHTTATSTRAAAAAAAVDDPHDMGTPDRELLTHLRLERRLLQMERDFLQRALTQVPETVSIKVSTARANDEVAERQLLAQYAVALARMKSEGTAAGRKRNAGGALSSGQNISSSHTKGVVAGGKKKPAAGNSSSSGGGATTMKTTTTTSTSTAAQECKPNKSNQGKNHSAASVAETGQPEKKNTLKPAPPPQQQQQQETESGEQACRRLEAEVEQRIAETRQRKEDLEALLKNLKAVVQSFLEKAGAM